MSFNFQSKRILTVGLVAVATSMLVMACTGGTKTDSEIYDPIENTNRTLLKINDAVDRTIAEPIARGYRAVTPDAGRAMIRNFLRNLNSPVIIGNELLQGDFKGAGNATGRFIINTLAGFGGIFDFASEGGIEYQPEDFGQTLAKWGVGDGMYIMIPLLGPSTLRDASGKLVDSYVDPLRIYLFNIDEKHLHYTRVGSELLSNRTDLIDVIDDLRSNSFDYYAAIRSAYYQRRQALINDSNGGSAIPNYEDF